MAKSRLWCFLVIVSFLPYTIVAQAFNWKARLNVPPRSGFYEIALDPGLTAKLKSDLSDLRIMDSAGVNVAYLLKSVKETSRTLVPVPILGITTDSLESHIEVGVRGHGGTDQLFLVIGNTEVARPARISGSNDGRQWFIVADDVVLSPSPESRNDRLLQSLRFPFNRYPYLKIVIHNGRSDPLNVLQAAIYNPASTNRSFAYIANSASSFTQQERDKKSIITIRHTEPFLTDRLVFAVKGPRFYKRNARLLITTEHAPRADVIQTFQLASGGVQTVRLPSLKVRSMIVEIENADDAPLEVESVRTEQEQRSVVTYLQRGVAYFLFAGNAKATSPSFDLSGFTDSIPTMLPLLTYTAPVQKTRSQPGTGNPAWLWAVIVFTVVVLGFITFRLTKDVDRGAGGTR